MLPTGFTLVPFSKQHAASAAEIERRVFSEPWSLASIEAVFLGGGYISALACLDEDGHLAAYGGIECIFDEGNIVNIATAPEYRRLGCASAVMGGLLSLAAERDCTRVTLEVREHNIPAQALYLSFGFSPVGVRRHFYSLPTEDAIVMEKHLVQNGSEHPTVQQ